MTWEFWADAGTRLAMAAVLAAVGMGLFWAWNRWQLRRLARTAAAGVPGLEAFRPGTPAILYFTTPDCGVCRAVQRPALDRLQADLAGRVQVFTVDATAQPAVADHWGVLSVPTTFIVDAAGRARRVNHGLANKDKLQRQLEEVDQEHTGGPRGRRETLLRRARPQTAAASVEVEYEHRTRTH